MRIITARRVAQIFFFALFVWFCLVSTLGERLWQLRGWPVNWFFQLDPLVGLGVVLASGSLFRGLLWCTVVIGLTFFVGRFFCGWLCPMGTLQQAVGFLAQRRRTTARRVAANRPHRGQAVKYWILMFLLAAAAADMAHFLFSGFGQRPVLYLLVLSIFLLAFWMAFERGGAKAIAAFLAVIGAGAVLHWWSPDEHWLQATLQIGILDPITFISRFVNLALLPVLDNPVRQFAPGVRHYEGSVLIGGLFALVLLLCLRAPRFYCRYVCPLGALYGLIGRRPVWRIGRSGDHCRSCRQCESYCEGACGPTDTIDSAECVLCFNCTDRCRHAVVAFGPAAAMEAARPGPDLERRHVVAACALGLVSVPVVRLDGALAENWRPNVIRPPGALDEPRFLARCIKCGQCMRICPTNVIHPATWQAGVEGLWTPVLNYRVGTSGCQQNCVACSRICPTAALRPLTVDERMGRGPHAAAGPVRLGMAFVDRGRCLPWAMDTPCIVCQENCPVSPKAIFTRTEFRLLRDGRQSVRAAQNRFIDIEGNGWGLDTLAGGDYFIQWGSGPPAPIAGNNANRITLAADAGPSGLPRTGDTISVRVRLQLPYVDPRQCIGCGICEHECPVQGRRAIRVTAENETRHRSHGIVVTE